MFKDKFNHLLKRDGVTVYAISKDLKIPKTTLYDWSNGKTEPTMKNLKVLAEWFNVPADYFFD